VRLAPLKTSLQQLTLPPTCSFDMVRQVLKLKAANDDLVSQEVEDRKRIQHLLALTEPLSHEVWSKSMPEFP